MSKEKEFFSDILFPKAQIELTLAEVMHIVRAVGFEVEMKAPIVTSYAADRNSMMQTVYTAALFVATKPK
jgi:hypothetical protein